MSVAWITVILVIVCLLNIASNIVYLTAVTRDLFAFARDKGLPFSRWLSTIHPEHRTPVNASIFSSTLAVLLSMMYMGSPVAFYAMTSLLTVALLQCYCLSMDCVLWRRIYRPETLPSAQYSLGRWRIPGNATAVVYSLWAFFWCFWPQAVPVTASGYNWASPIILLPLIVAMVYFAFKARLHYVGPMPEVEERKAHFG